MFLCPLCLERGCAVTLVAELEEVAEDPTRRIVADVQGGCAHARGFGELGGQALVNMRRVIEVALAAARSSPARPGQEPREGAERRRPPS
jgi:hypothetical protein